MKILTLYPPPRTDNRRMDGFSHIIHPERLRRGVSLILTRVTLCQEFFDSLNAGFERRVVSKIA
jgi:hypothetical protein